MISTIAGSKERGVTGDGGLAARAQTYGPADLITGSGDRVFPADGANRVRTIGFLRPDRGAARDGWRIW